MKLVRVDGVETPVYHQTITAHSRTSPMLGRLVLRDSVLELGPWNLASELLAVMWAGGITEIRGLEYPLVNLTMDEYRILQGHCGRLPSVGEKYVCVKFWSDPTLTVKAVCSRTFQTRTERDAVEQELKLVADAAHSAVVRSHAELAAKTVPPSEQSVPIVPEKSNPPDYFHTLAEAAAYAKVTKRTIQNWKKLEWLKVEQNGRKIRIARSELDKCRLKL